MSPVDEGKRREVFVDVGDPATLTDERIDAIADRLWDAMQEQAARFPDPDRSEPGISSCPHT